MVDPSVFGTLIKDGRHVRENFECRRPWRLGVLLQRRVELIRLNSTDFPYKSQMSRDQAL